MTNPASPAAVLGDATLSLEDKRALLSAWLAAARTADDGDAESGRVRELQVALDALDTLSAVDTSRGS